MHNAKGSDTNSDTDLSSVTIQSFDIRSMHNAKDSDAQVPKSVHKPKA